MPSCRAWHGDVPPRDVPRLKGHNIRVGWSLADEFKHLWKFSVFQVMAISKVLFSGKFLKMFPLSFERHHKSWLAGNPR